MESKEEAKTEEHAPVVPRRDVVVAPPPAVNAWASGNTVKNSMKDPPLPPAAAPVFAAPAPVSAVPTPAGTSMGGAGIVQVCVCVCVCAYAYACVR